MYVEDLMVTLFLIISPSSPITPPYFHFICFLIYASIFNRLLRTAQFSLSICLVAARISYLFSIRFFFNFFSLSFFLLLFLFYFYFFFSFPFLLPVYSLQ